MNNFKITPISHATLVLEWNGKIIYTDPAEGLEVLKKQPTADLILLTDIHHDHLIPAELPQFVKEQTQIVCPQAVFDLLPETLKNQSTIIVNGQTNDIAEFKIQAVPMYNFPVVENPFHPKGRGNGYIIEADGERVYLSGDTGNIPEMAEFKNIDVAFLCMNLPYTMSVEDAAKATVTMQPKQIIPYHYRGPEGLSDTQKFKELVNQANPNITVNLINFYPS